MAQEHSFYISKLFYFQIYSRMPHLHYSPFQWANSVQASEQDVSAKKAVKTLNKITAKDAAKAKHIPTTMPRAAAHEVIANVSPNAFISPNPPDVMRMAKAVFGN
jgi:hypothetical protein